MVCFFLWRSATWCMFTECIVFGEWCYLCRTGSLPVEGIDQASLTRALEVKVWLWARYVHAKRASVGRWQLFMQAVRKATAPSPGSGWATNTKALAAQGESSATIEAKPMCKCSLNVPRRLLFIQPSQSKLIGALLW